MTIQLIGYSGLSARISQAAKGRTASTGAETAATQGSDLPQPPKALQEKIQSILKNGGSMSDVQSEMKSQFQQFSQSDQFKALPKDVQSKMTDMDKNGPSGFGGGSSPLAYLQSKGASLQQSVLAKFGIGGTNAGRAGGSSDSTGVDVSEQLRQSLAGTDDDA